MKVMKMVPKRCSVKIPLRKFAQQRKTWDIDLQTPRASNNLMIPPAVRSTDGREQQGRWISGRPPSQLLNGHDLRLPDSVPSAGFTDVEQRNDKV